MPRRITILIYTLLIYGLILSLLLGALYVVPRAGLILGLAFPLSIAGAMFVSGWALNAYEVQFVIQEALSNESPATRKSIAPTVRAFVLQRDFFTCTYCQRQGDALDPDGHPWHIDHVIPVSRGGPTKPGNLTTACRRCNSRKKDKSPFQFLRER